MWSQVYCLFFLCATVGATPSGSTDPIEGLGLLAQKYGLWFHIDAAYAGSALICPELRHYLIGTEHASSISMNLHKWFLTNLDCSGLWVKNRSDLLDTLSMTAEVIRNDAACFEGEASDGKLTSRAEFNFNTFESTFPNWLANVSSLEYADLSYCNLNGRISLGLSELPSLSYLNLAGNNNLSASSHKLFGGSWTNIKVLDFSPNKLHGKLPDTIGNMTFLTNFSLMSNNINGGIPSSIGKLCNLVDFDLSGNNLTGSLPEKLVGSQSCASKTLLPSLVRLWLSNNKLVGKLPNWLGHIPNLLELSLNYNFLEGPIPDSLGTLKKLTDLGWTLGRFFPAL
ncbi:hypothetical protein POM88_002363 [Heracleum sosnowskyi]|uniref:Uncharacterized protein n=1 Tax=Heracleum sosnowskyi TaxID=360622 RepID=A0AAD8JFD2_9APIA|nr:hypothetical protein POM88_002363 [Heracleum sosnowskyi]